MVFSTSERESESESAQWDPATDKQLQQKMSARLATVKVGSAIELQLETNLGDLWFDGVVRHLHGNGVVRFVEDEDGSVHNKLDLKVEIWKFL